MFIFQQLSLTSGRCHFGLHQLKEIISQATHYLRDGFHSTSTEDDSTTLEHAAVSHCIIQLYTSRVLPQDANKLQDLVQSYFPATHQVPHGSDSPPRKDGIPAVLLEAVQSELSDRHLQCLPALMEKVCAKIVLLSLKACSTDVMLNSIMATHTIQVNAMQYPS